ncbi:MAG: tyrosine-type recombinase/integrase [Alphaproteobacteria bacterium]
MSTELESVAEFLTGNRMAVLSLPWQSLRSEDVRVLRDWAGETLPFPVQRRLMRDLRQALRQPAETEDEAVLRSEVTPSVLRALRRSVAASKLAGRQAKLLLDACEADGTTEGARDAAVISLMLGAGLRRQEVVGLQRGDYEDEDGRIKVGSPRGLARSVILEDQTRATVERWLRLRGAWSGPLIAALSPHGDVQMRGLTPSAVNRLLAKRSDQAGCAGITPRDLRGRFLRELQAASRERPRCRYYQDENGQPAWVLAPSS